MSVVLGSINDTVGCFSWPMRLQVQIFMSHPLSPVGPRIDAVAFKPTPKALSGWTIHEDL